MVVVYLFTVYRNVILLPLVIFWLFVAGHFLAGRQHQLAHPPLAAQWAMSVMAFVTIAFLLTVFYALWI